MEKKKNKLQKELKNTKSSKNSLKIELNKCQELLANTSKKVSAQTAELNTQSLEVTDIDVTSK